MPWRSCSGSRCSTRPGSCSSGCSPLWRGLFRQSGIGLLDVLQGMRDVGERELLSMRTQRGPTAPPCPALQGRGAAGARRQALLYPVKKLRAPEVLVAPGTGRCRVGRPIVFAGGEVASRLERVVRALGPELSKVDGMSQPRCFLFV
mmetsp:Transcript_86512/g.231897  ORF Transcript_86512/g.231897 Transcript_86512/m.231897 type:complete len:147 (-) Transcript_86512:441-881(-)